MKRTLTPQKRNTLPRSPGVYLFLYKETVLYVGKATNLRSRVQSYYTGNDTRGDRIHQMVAQATSITVHSTETVLEAVIMESNLIKKYQPKYNVDLKDDKSFSYFVITKEVYPRVIIERQTNIYKIDHKRIYGPYTSRKNMEIVLKILRKIFPFHSSGQKTEKGCLHFQIGLCSGPYEKAISRKEYLKNIRNIEYVLRGQKKRLLSTLQKEMTKASKQEQFEYAANIRNKIHAFQHIRDIALITKEPRSFRDPRSSEHTRIEGYDISNISGEHAVGSMVVFIDGRPETSLYRKFKIQAVEGINDVAMMREVLARRLRHAEWEYPDVLLLDGGKGHLNMAEKVCEAFDHTIGLVALAKGPTRKKLDLHLSKSLAPDPKIVQDMETLEKVRDEAHRFAIGYHRKLRKKNFIRK